MGVRIGHIRISKKIQAEAARDGGCFCWWDCTPGRPLTHSLTRPMLPCCAIESLRTRLANWSRFAELVWRTYKMTFMKPGKLVACCSYRHVPAASSGHRRALPDAGMGLASDASGRSDALHFSKLVSGPRRLHAIQGLLTCQGFRCTCCLGPTARLSVSFVIPLNCVR